MDGLETDAKARRPTYARSIINVGKAQGLAADANRPEPQRLGPVSKFDAQGREFLTGVLGFPWPVT
jgi:hypothetical protein